MKGIIMNKPTFSLVYFQQKPYLIIVPWWHFQKVWGGRAVSHIHTLISYLVTHTSTKNYNIKEELGNTSLVSWGQEKEACKAGSTCKQRWQRLILSVITKGFKGSDRRVSNYTSALQFSTIQQKNVELTCLLQSYLFTLHNFACFTAWYKPARKNG